VKWTWCRLAPGWSGSCRRFVAGWCRVVIGVPTSGRLWCCPQGGRVALDSILRQRVRRGGERSEHRTNGYLGCDFGPLRLANMMRSRPRRRELASDSSAEIKIYKKNAQTGRSALRAISGFFMALSRFGVEQNFAPGRGSYCRKYQIRLWPLACSRPVVAEAACASCSEDGVVRARRGVGSFVRRRPLRKAALIWRRLGSVCRLIARDGGALCTVGKCHRPAMVSAQTRQPKGYLPGSDGLQGRLRAVDAGAEPSLTPAFTTFHGAIAGVAFGQ